MENKYTMLRKGRVCISFPQPNTAKYVQWCKANTGSPEFDTRKMGSKRQPWVAGVYLEPQDAVAFKLRWNMYDESESSS